MLNRFLSQVSALCEGHSTELDEQLEKIKTLAAQGQELSSMSEEITQLSNVLEVHLQDKGTQRDHYHQELLHSSNYLEQSHYLTPGLKTEIELFQQNMSVTPATLEDLLPKIQQLLSYFQTVLSNQGKISMLKEQKLLKLTRSYSEQLLGILEEANLSQELRLKINAVSHHLEGNISPEELFSICQKLLVMVLENIKLDKAASKDFLDSLNKALANVREIMDQSFNLNSDHGQSRSKWNQELKEHLGSMESNLGSAPTLNSVRKRLADEFNQLSELLHHKETIDNQENQALTELLSNMENRLTEVESEAQFYKDKLLKQQQLSMRDSLTQLPNRAALDERLASEFKRSQLFRRNLWVVVADIDLFKNINDNYGHSAGDKTLQVIASALSRTLRESEFIARFGGEEFVILVPNLKEAELLGMLNRVRERIKNIPFMFKQEKVRITISMGVAQVYDHDEGEEQTFERADAALYKAKRQGRDQVVIADS